MSADKLRNLAKVPGMSDLIGSMGVEVLNEIADSYSEIHEALKDVIGYAKNRYTDVHIESHTESILKAEQALNKAKGGW